MPVSLKLESDSCIMKPREKEKNIMDMDAKKVKKIRNITTAVSVVLLVGVAVTLYFAVKMGLDKMVFNGIIIAFLLVFWVMMDIVEPRLLRQLEGISQERKMAYYKYLALGLVEYGGLAYFVLTLGTDGNSGLLGAVVYAVGLSTKRRFRDEYMGTAPKKDEQ